MIEIIHKTKNLIVINKPHGMPAQSDPSGDKDAMTAASELLRENGEDGRLWLIHRLDRVVGGLMVFARNKKYAGILSEMVKDRLLSKEYYAVVDGDAEGGMLEDLLYRDAKVGKSFIVDRERAGVKCAVLSYKRLASVQCDHGKKTLVYISLMTGRFHQIRAQFSHRGMPICGDGKYGSRDNKVRNIALMSAHMDFETSGERVDVSVRPDISKYPWSLFNEFDYDIRREL